ncbi:MAG: glutamate 5-kinase [Pseudomonadota bacterium]
MSEGAASAVAASPLTTARRVVVKIGSALLIDEVGDVRTDWLSGIAEDVAEMRARGQGVAIVSSGAVALGRRKLGLTGKLRLEEKQAAAAAGQSELIHAYEAALRPHGVKTGQLLLTLDDAENRRRYLNARATFRVLMELGAAPIVNENDTIATAEIRYGDNDRLAAHVAQMAGAECLVLLSDIDGLYSSDPRADVAAQFVPEVTAVTPEIEAMAGVANPASGVGTGGMATKLVAAKIALNAGCAMAIAQGDRVRPLAALWRGERCTWFRPSVSPRTARKTWIAGRLKPQGTLRVDAGAQKALSGGASLLPAGVTAVEGAFRRGDAVRIEDASGEAFAVGLAAFDAPDARRIAGRKSADIQGILGYQGRPAMVDHDDLVIFADAGEG